MSFTNLYIYYIVDDIYNADAFDGIKNVLLFNIYISIYIFKQEFLLLLKKKVRTLFKSKTCHSQIMVYVFFMQIVFGREKLVFLLCLKELVEHNLLVLLHQSSDQRHQPESKHLVKPRPWRFYLSLLE